VWWKDRVINVNLKGFSRKQSCCKRGISQHLPGGTQVFLSRFEALVNVMTTSSVNLI
jgi:hypothetical protein